MPTRQFYEGTVHGDAKSDRIVDRGVTRRVGFIDPIGEVATTVLKTSYEGMAL
jgi:hypothetical protein